MENKTEKILLLSLGTGQLEKQNFSRSNNEANITDFDKAISERFYQKTSGYQKTTYSLNGNLKTSSFIAEVLVEDCSPDKIYILGTVRSNWLDFYSCYAKDGIVDDAIVLGHIMKEHGLETNLEQLQELEKLINKIYKNAGVALKTQDDRSVPVNVRLLRYGTTQKQLHENYSIVRGILQLEKDVHYEISFDVTHAFRSAPLYNLIILNYYRQVLGYDISIPHVYYGMFDVRSETGGCPPVIDLASIADILDLTNGACEFRNTGNASTLLKHVNNQELRTALTAFDGATQFNNLNLIEKSINVLNRVNPDQEDPFYSDLTAMVDEVVKEKFNRDAQENNAHFGYEDKAERQYQLSKWHKNQNHYGQAIATALEGMKSYLVQLTLPGASPEEYLMDENRREAERIMLSVQTAANIPNNEGMQLLRSLAEAVIEAKKIRNTFAHNLDSVELDDVILEIARGKKIVDTFFSRLSELRDYMKNPDRRALLKKSFYDLAQLSPALESALDPKHVRVILTYTALDREFIKRLSSSNSYHYKLYIIEENVSCKLKQMTAQHQALFLLQYINKYFANSIANELMSLVIIKPDARLQSCAQFLLSKNKFKVFFCDPEATENSKYFYAPLKRSMTPDEYAAFNNQSLKQAEKAMLESAPMCYGRDGLPM